MLYSIFSVLPFMVCLFWAILYGLQWKERTNAQHMIFFFACVCAILYLCHAQFFLGGRNLWTESLWMACSLASYPVSYLYIIELTMTERQLPRLPLLLFLPAVVLPIIHLTMPAWNIKILQGIIYIPLTLYICIMGIIRLYGLEREIQNYYTDDEDKSPIAIRWFFMCSILSSIFSVVFSLIGRETFHEDLRVAIPSILFSTLLFVFFYIGDHYKFSARLMQDDDFTPPPTKRGKYLSRTRRRLSLLCDCNN